VLRDPIYCIVNDEFNTMRNRSVALKFVGFLD
jgi:hypothetical protein